MPDERQAGRPPVLAEELVAPGHEDGAAVGRVQVGPVAAVQELGLGARRVGPEGRGERERSIMEKRGQV